MAIRFKILLIYSLLPFSLARADEDPSFSFAYNEALKIPQSYRFIEPSWGIIISDEEGRIWRDSSLLNKTFSNLVNNADLFQSPMRGKNFKLAIQPIYIENREIPLFTIADAWLSLHGMSLRDSDILNMEPIDQDEREPWLKIDLIHDLENETVTLSTLIARLDSVVVIVNAWKAHEHPFDNLPKFGEILKLYPEVSLSQIDKLPRSAKVADQATLINHVGLSLFNQGNLIWASDLFKKAHNLDPFTKDYFLNALLALQQSGRFEEVSSFIAKAPIALQKLPTTVQYEVASLTALGESEKAVEILKNEIDRGIQNESIVIQYMNSLFHLEEFEEVRDVGIEALQKGLRSSTIQSNLGWAYIRLKDYENAKTTFQNMGRLLQTNAEASYGWMQILIDEENFTDCAEFGIDLFESTGDLSALSFGIRSLIETGDRELAEQYIATGLKRNPANTDILQWDEYLKSLAGEGVSRGASTPIEALVISDEIKHQIRDWKEESGPEADTFSQNVEDKGAVYEEITTITDWKPGESYTTTTRLVATIKSKSAIDAFKQFVFSFNPFSESIYVNKIEVRDAKGTIIARENRDKFVVRHEDSSAYATEDRILIVPIPNLRQGRTMELVYTRLRRGKEVKFPFTQHFFKGSYPVRESHYVLSENGESLIKKSLGHTFHANTKDGSIWSTFSEEGLPNEDNLPTPVQIEPVLRVAGIAESWEILVAEYKNRIEHTLAETDKSTEKWIQSHTTRHEEIKETIASILTAIRENFNYQGYVFGERAQVPNLPSDIVSNGYGDCKDLSLLLHKSLESMGILSHLALVNTQGAIDSTMPSVDQFNHMIVYCPDIEGSSRFLDPTDSYATGLTDPTNLQNIEALVLDWDNPRFEVIEESTVEETPVHAVREIALESNGDINLTESITMRGRIGENMKRWLSIMTPTERRDAIQRWMNFNKLTLQVDSVALQNEDELYEPLKIEITANTRSDELQANLANVLKIPIISETLFIGVPQTQDRIFDYQRVSSCHITVDTKLSTPPGWIAKIATKNYSDYSRKFGISYSANWNLSGTELIGTNLIRVEKPIIPAGEFETYKSHLSESLNQLGPKIDIIPNRSDPTKDVSQKAIRL